MSSIELVEVKLFTRLGKYVATVLIPRVGPRPEVLQWWSRFFVRGEGGVYREGVCYPALTRDEWLAVGPTRGDGDASL